MLNSYNKYCDMTMKLLFLLIFDLKNSCYDLFAHLWLLLYTKIWKKEKFDVDPKIILFDGSKKNNDICVFYQLKIMYSCHVISVESLSFYFIFFDQAVKIQEFRNTYSFMHVSTTCKNHVWINEYMKKLLVKWFIVWLCGQNWVKYYVNIFFFRFRKQM